MFTLVVSAIGIEYTVRYQANNRQFFINHDKRYIYRKRFDNFRQKYSLNNRTAKKQHARFKRRCDRVFHSTHKQITDPIHMDMEYKLAVTKKHRFLFLNHTLLINKSIKHLRYHKFDKS